jgi:hypothetical protein
MYILWKTKSIDRTGPVTIMVSVAFVISLSHRLFSSDLCAVSALLALTVLVWRIIPCSRVPRNS